MKKLSVITFCLCVFRLLHAQVSFSDAIAYNDYIVTEQNNIVQSVLELSAAFADSGSTQEVHAAIWKKYENLRLQVAASVSKINELTVFEGNTEFLEATKAVFSFYQHIAVHDYHTLVSFITNEQTNAVDLQNVMKMLEELTAQEALLDIRFTDAQNDFAMKYGFVLSENELQNKIDDLNKQ